jgi:hypothetical protein
LRFFLRFQDRRAFASRKKGLAPNRPSHAKRLPIVQIKAKSRFGFSFMDHSLNETRVDPENGGKSAISLHRTGVRSLCVCAKSFCV